MPKSSMLPGVTKSARPPRISCDAHAAIRKARRAAGARDVLQLLLVLAVDFLFVYWPQTRMPFLDREQSLMLLRSVNAIVFAHVWLSRALPKWSARRIAETWSRTERERFR